MTNSDIHSLVTARGLKVLCSSHSIFTTRRLSLTILGLILRLFIHEMLQNVYWTLVQYADNRRRGSMKKVGLISHVFYHVPDYK